jgi:trans-aconitate methyltransferase
METIYQRPRDYDLEHEGDDEDVAFYVRLLEKWQPRRVMELASGSGRVTIPLARAAAASGAEIVGLEREVSMLEEAYRKRAALSDTERTCLSFVEADMRDWQIAGPRYGHQAAALQDDQIHGGVVRRLRTARASCNEPSDDRRRSQGG